MATVTTATPIAPAMPPQPPPPAPAELYRFNVDEYERMVLDDPRVELINGYVVKKVPKKPKHSWTTKAVLKSLGKPDAAGVDVAPGAAGTHPRFRRARAGRRDRPGHATTTMSIDIPALPTSVSLVEVSEATLDRDRNEKLPAYARGGIPVYWIINLVDRQVEVYTDPGPDGYRSSQVFTPGQSVPVVIDGRLIGQIAVDDILR